MSAGSTAKVGNTRVLDVVYAAAIIAAAIALLWFGRGQTQEALSVANDPFWYPKILLWSIAACAVFMAGQAWIADVGAGPLSMRWLRLGIAVMLTVAYLMAYQRVGFAISTLVMIPAMGWFLGYRRPVVLALVSLGFTVVVWYAFHFLLQIMLPGIGLPTAFF